MNLFKIKLIGKEIKNRMALSIQKIKIKIGKQRKINEQNYNTYTILRMNMHLLCVLHFRINEIKIV